MDCNSKTNININISIKLKGTENDKNEMKNNNKAFYYIRVNNFFFYAYHIESKQTIKERKYFLY